MGTWVIVTGDVGMRGGQDKANLALAAYLAERGDRTHLVAHSVDSSLSGPGVSAHLVKKPLDSYLLGQFLLDRTGRRVAREALRADPGTRVVVNGGNCRWADINWVHALHHAWRPADSGAPLAFRLKNRVTTWLARRGERSIIRSARLVFANSQRTKQTLVSELGIEEGRVRLQYLGCDPQRFGPVDEDARRSTRARLGVRENQIVAVFVGALGFDRNKGLDTLLAAWKRLQGDPSWDGVLLAAGGGALPFWQRLIESLDLVSAVRLLGMTKEIDELLAAADVLVSPSRYEAYGLNVHEALCRGIPAIVSASAGIAERYPPELEGLLLRDPEDDAELAVRLQRWRQDRSRYRQSVAQFGEALRAFSWRDMAHRMVATIEAIT